MIKIEDEQETFNKFYNKPYISANLKKEIEKANVLLIPTSRIDKNGNPLFAEITDDFFSYLKQFDGDKLKTDICVDDDKYQKLELHADIIYITEMILQWAVLPIVTNIIASFLYSIVTKMGKKENEINTKVKIIVEKNGKSKKITYDGNIENFSKAIEKINEEIFK